MDTGGFRRSNANTHEHELVPRAPQLSYYIAWPLYSGNAAAKHTDPHARTTRPPLPATNSRPANQLTTSA